MPRFVVALLLLLAGLGGSANAASASGIPARPVPFTFVTDQANLLKPGEAQKLETGLRHYADKTGTQVVVVTVPSLDGTDVADYGRQLGTAWGVGQRGKDNGIVVLLSGKEHQMTIQAGSGLKSSITPELTSRVINQEMTPAFKQGNYLAGLRKGLSSLMLAANPSSNPNKNTAASAATASTEVVTPSTTSSDLTTTSTASADPIGVQQTEAPASSGGLGMGALLIGALVIIGGIWLLLKLFRRNTTNTAGASQSPDFIGNRPANATPNFGAPNAGYPPQNPGYGAAPSNSGSGMGGILATGAAAAAGAYLGNRLSSNHDSGASAPHNLDTNTNAGLGVGAAAGTGAADDYFSSKGNEAANTAEPDYFSDNATADNSGDYFSTDNSSYDDTSSDNTGGGGFDSSDDNRGSW